MDITDKHLDVKDAKFKLNLLQISNLLGTIFGVWYLINTQEYHWIWVSLIMWFILGHICKIVVMHRLLSHRSFKTYSWLERILTFMTIYSGAGSTLFWVGTHRMHHHLSDRENDPYSPYIGNHYSLYKAFLLLTGNMYMSHLIDRRYVRDIVNNPLHKFIHNHYFKLLYIPLVLFFCYDPILFVFAYSIPAFLTYHMFTWFNILAHIHGYVTYDTKDFSKNSWIVAVFTLGEGWHNNHHMYPRKYTTTVKWWEFDPCGWVIRIIKK